MDHCFTLANESSLVLEDADGAYAGVVDLDELTDEKAYTLVVVVVSVYAWEAMKTSSP